MTQKARHAELYRARRWETYAAWNVSDSLAEVAEKLGATVNQARLAGKKLGLPGYRRRGPKPGTVPVAPWRDEAVALRQKEFSYREIGNQIGVSGERVRQILNQEAPELTGYIYGRRPKKECPICGEEFTVLRDGQETCSRKCWSELCAKTITDREREIFAACVAGREAGKTWNSINVDIGWSVNPRGSRLPSHFKEICAKMGIDPFRWMTIS